MTPLDIRQEPKKILLSRFNYINSLQLNPDDFTMSAPEAFTDNSRKTNTRVLLTPNVTSSGYNQFHIYYNRMELSDVFDRINLRVETAGLDYLYEILDLVNVALGINLLTDDLEDTAIVYDDPNDKTARASVTLICKPTSYLFKGTYELFLNTTLKPYDPGTKSPVTGLAFLESPSKTDVININTSLSDETYFRLFSGAGQVNSYSVSGIKCLGNKAYVFGNFNMEPNSNITGAQGLQDYKGIVVDGTGRVSKVDQVAKFDGVFQKNVEFKSTPDKSKFYLADKRAIIQNPNLAGLYRYNANGERDNTLLVNTLGWVVNKVLPFDSGFIAASVMNDVGKKVILKRFRENGSIDPAMLEIEIVDLNGSDIEVSDIVLSHDDNGDPDGFYVLVSTFFSQPLVPVVNGQPVYGDKHLDRNNYILPILKFRLDGNLDQSFNGSKGGYSRNFLKQELGITEYKRLHGNENGVVLFTHTANPMTGAKTLLSYKIKPNGDIHINPTGSFTDLPVVESVTAIESFNDVYLASVVVDEYDSTDTPVKRSKVLGFDKNGQYIGPYLDLENSNQIKDIVIFVK